MRNSWARCKEPHAVSFFIALILFVIALLAQFNYVRVGEAMPWLWIIGFGLLLLAVRIKGL